MKASHALKQFQRPSLLNGTKPGRAVMVQFRKQGEEGA